MSSFRGKTVVVTGAARGIGKSTAEVLAEREATLVLIDRDEARLAAVVDALSTSTDVMHVVGDVSDEATVDGLFAAALERFGAVDCLASNAGIIGRAASIADTTLEEYQALMRINTQSAFLFVRAFVRAALAADRTGSIVLTGSTAGIRGSANLVSYSTSKQALQGMTRSAAAELGPRNIRVNAVVPGRIDTGFMDMFSTREEATAGLEARPLARIADPREVGYLIAWLLSDEASFATGGIYPIDGGFSA
jgi:NAD(P)-dependent dehydrogenase (short-subunit alcohol dehydrogenase family)